jgi:hypothetical protein
VALIFPVLLVPPLPAAPCGIPKFSTAAELVPLLFTVAEAPAASVVTVPTVTDAAAPAGPVAPAVPAAPAAPGAPAAPACASNDQFAGYRSGSMLVFVPSARYVDPA